MELNTQTKILNKIKEIRDMSELQTLNWSMFTVLLNDLGNYLMKEYEKDYDFNLNSMIIAFIHNYRQGFWNTRMEVEVPDVKLLEYYKLVIDDVENFILNKGNKIHHINLKTKKITEIKFP